MKRSQLILLAVGIIAIAGFYALPTAVVDTKGDADSISQGTEEASSTSTDPASLHESELSSDQIAEIVSFRAQVEGGDSEEGKVQASLALADIYQGLSKYDSAGYYLGLAFEEKQELELAEKAGLAYYEAFSFALDPDKVANTAELTRTYLSKVLDKDPSRLDLKTKVAMTYVSSTNPMQGITMMREILEADPQNEDALFNMGVLSMQSGQYKRATERFEELLQYHPENLQGQFYLGVSYFEANLKNKAKAQFEKVKAMTDDQMILGSVQSYLDRL
jgi:tetratricopeptide (TPR) repeat protein